MSNQEKFNLGIKDAIMVNLVLAGVSIIAQLTISVVFFIKSLILRVL